MALSDKSSNIERVILAHGGGGELMNRLIADHILPKINNDTLSHLGDGAVLPMEAGRPVMTTDSYVVTPLEFPGGDIGKLAVAGTVNDLAVMGAIPRYLSLGLIIEEGLPLDVLDRVVDSIAATAKRAGVAIVTGDTKVIERRNSPTATSEGGSDGLFINTAGLGFLPNGMDIRVDRIEPGDVILINGPIAEHGLAVMSKRSGIGFESALQTDAVPLNHMISAMVDTGANIKFMRDATRGGIAGVLADISESNSLSVEVWENEIPVTPTARHAAEMLGLDPLAVANEGKVLCVVNAEQADQVLEAMRRCPEGRESVMIGRVSDSQPPLVELLTRAGGRRVVQRPYGEDLPRIC